jgi:hypothetical protein
VSATAELVHCHLAPTPGIRAEVIQSLSPQIEEALVEIGRAPGYEKPAQRSQHPLFREIASTEGTTVGEVGFHRRIPAAQAIEITHGALHR